MSEKILLQGLQRQKASGLIRESVVIDKRQGNRITINGKSCINFASNDYLAIATCQKTTQTFYESAKQYGFGSGSSVAVSGYFSPQRQLEREFAHFMQRDKALFFNSGYLANLAVLSCLVARDNVVLSDRLCHASLLDGILLSRAKHYRYKHQNMQDLENCLQQIDAPCFIVTESVFSMEGDITPLADIVTLAKRYDASVIVDDAHGFGVLTSGSCCDYHQLDQSDIACLITPLGKAFGGSGAMVSGSTVMINHLLQFARSYRYTTALPPAVPAANLKALDIVMTEQWRQRQLQSIIAHFMQKATQLELPLLNQAATPIQSILIGDNHKVQEIQQKLLTQGFYISCIRPPTVPVGSARIRISLNCQHKPEQIDRLLDMMVNLL